jgi:hypothetical protein
VILFIRYVYTLKLLVFTCRIKASVAVWDNISINCLLIAWFWSRVLLSHWELQRHYGWKDHAVVEMVMSGRGLDSLHDCHRYWQCVVCIDARIGDITECIPQNVDEPKLMCHVTKHAWWEAGTFVLDLFFECSTPPASIHLLNLGDGVAY